MAGPGGVEVGRAKVRVVADSSKFVADVKAIAEKIEKTIRIEIPTGLDIDGVKAEIDRFKARIKAETQKNPVTAKIPIEATKLDEWGKRVKADVAKLQRQIEIDLPVTADAEQLRRDVAAKVRAIETGLQIGVPIDVEQAAQFRAETLQIVAEVEAIAKASHPTIEVETSVDNDSLGRAASSIAKQVGGARDLTKVSSQLGLMAGKAGAALATWGPPLLLAAGAAAAIAPSLAVAVPAMSGLGVGAGVLALSLHGVGDALKLAFDPKKTAEFKQAMDRLSPAARGVVTAIVALKKPFQDLQRAVQAAFLKGVGPVLERVGKRVLPVLSGALTQVASRMNTALKGLLEFVGASKTLGLVKDLISSSTSALSPLGGAFKDITTALLQIGVAAAPALKSLNKSIAAGVGAFAKWIDKASKSGKLTEIISTGAESLKRVFAVLGKVIAGVGDILVAIGPDSVTAFEAVGTVVGIVVSGLKKLGPIISQNKALFIALGLGLLALVAPATAAAGAVVAVVVAFQQYGPQIMATIQPFVTAFQTAWVTISAAVQAAIPTIQGAIGYVVAAFQSLGPNITALVGAFQNMFTQVKPIVAQFVAIFVEHWPQIKDTVKSVFDSVMVIVRSALSITTSLVRIATDTIVGIWNLGFGKTIVGILRGAMTIVLGVIKGAFQIVSGLFQVVASVMQGDWRGAWDGIKRVVSGAKTIIVSVVRGLWEAVKGVFAGAKQFLVSVGGDIVAGLKNGIQSAAGAAVQAAKDMAANVKNAVTGFFKIGSPSKVMAKLGHWIVVGLAQGITKSRSALQAALKQITSIVMRAGDKGAIHAVTAVDDALLRRAKAREGLVARLTKASQKLGDLQKQSAQYAAQAKANVVATGNVTTFENSLGKTSMAIITKGLKGAVTKAREFAATIARLKKLGLNGTALDQIIQAGPDDGLAAAKAIAAGGKSAVDEVNKLQKQLAKAGGSVGDVGAKALYGAGIQAAKGLVDGLKSRISEITALMKQIAREMVATIRKELKIHSPSRVFRDLGRWTGRGLEAGIVDSSSGVRGAVAGMVPRQVRAPRFAGAGGASGGVAGGGPQFFPNATIVAADPEAAADVASRRSAQAWAAVGGAQVLAGVS